MEVMVELKQACETSSYWCHSVEDARASATSEMIFMFMFVVSRVFGPAAYCVFSLALDDEFTCWGVG